MCVKVADWISHEELHASGLSATWLAVLQDIQVQCVTIWRDSLREPRWVLVKESSQDSAKSRRILHLFAYDFKNFQETTFLERIFSYM